jgi:hypothetical protein
VSVQTLTCALWARDFKAQHRGKLKAMIGGSSAPPIEPEKITSLGVEIMRSNQKAPYNTQVGLPWMIDDVMSL